MAGGKPRDHRVELMVTGYQAIIDSVPTVNQPGEHGPLNADEITQTCRLMDRLAEQIAADRENPDGRR